MIRNGHSQFQRLPGLDGLRAVACLMVFGVHFAQNTNLAGGWGPFDLGRLFANGNTGVALFFCLSGFLLGRPYWVAMAGRCSAPEMGSYLAHRAARILPAYFVCLTLLLVANQFWNKADALRDALLHYALVFNFHGDAIFRVNPPFWTVAVESQFYILLPLLFLLVTKMSWRAGMTVMLALIGATYLAHAAVMSLALDGRDGSASAGRVGSHVLTYSLHAHLPHFLLGVVTGGLHVARARSGAPALPLGVPGDLAFWSTVSIIFVILSTALGDVLEWPYGRYNFPYVPLLLCAVIYLTPLVVSARRVLDSVLLRGIGAISYGVYIYHYPVLSLFKRGMSRAGIDPKEHWLVYGSVSLGATLAIAGASFLLLEKPVLSAVRARRSNRAA